MAKNQIFEWVNKLSMPVGSTTVDPGDVVKVGAFIGVAETNSAGPANSPNGLINSNEAGFATVAIHGAYRLTGVVVDAPLAYGDPLYLTTAGGVTNVSAVGSEVFAVAMQAVTVDGTVNIDAFLLGVGQGVIPADEEEV